MDLMVYWESIYCIAFSTETELENHFFHPFGWLCVLLPSLEKAFNQIN